MKAALFTPEKCSAKTSDFTSKGLVKPDRKLICQSAKQLRALLFLGHTIANMKILSYLLLLASLFVSVLLASGAVRLLKPWTQIERVSVQMISRRDGEEEPSSTCYR